MVSLFVLFDITMFCATIELSIIKYCNAKMGGLYN